MLEANFKIMVFIFTKIEVKGMENQACS